jgi:hypothetical protein
VYSAAPELDEPAHHGLDDDEAVPGADPGTPGSATVRRDMVIISQPPCQHKETNLIRRRWCCQLHHHHCQPSPLFVGSSVWSGATCHAHLQPKGGLSDMLSNSPAISRAAGIATHLTSLVTHTHRSAFIYRAWHMQCSSQS